MAIRLHPSMAVHPGPWLRRNVIEPYRLSVTETAERLHVTRPAMSNLLNGKADLSPAILSVTEVGAPVLVGGVPTQEYDVVVDLAKVTGPSGERLRAAAQQAAALGQHLPPMVTYHYWLAADGLEMRISYEMLGATWAMTFSQWGEPVDIQAPGADRMSNLDQD